MNKEYSKINIDIIKEFIDENNHDAYSFIKKVCYRNMYMSIYEFCFKKLNENNSLKDIIKISEETYNIQNKLNKSLKVTDGKYFDIFLMECVVSQIYKKSKHYPSLKNETYESLLEKIIQYNQEKSDNYFLNGYSISYLKTLIKNKFNANDKLNVNDFISYIDELSKEKEVVKAKKNILSFEEQLNIFIKKSNMSLNQIGQESLIKKNIYELSLGKLPTKNQLIMLIFTFCLSKEEQKKLILSAKEEIKNSSLSNMYSFEEENKRDVLLLHWMNNIFQLNQIALKRNKKMVEIVNEMLRDSKFEILK